MTRRIILILVGALLILALMFLLWFWLFGKQEQAEEQLGGFGSAGDRGAQGTGSGTGGNTEAVIGGTTDTAPGGGGSSGTNVQTPIYVTPAYDSPVVLDPAVDTSTDVDVPGVSWLDGTSGGGSGVSFTPTPINEINNVSVEGTAFFNNPTGNGGGGGGIGLGGALLGVAGGCVANYLVQKAAGAGASSVSAILGSLSSVRTYDQADDANETANGLIACVVRALARIAIQQLTAQTVAWINSGFNGEPAYVQDFGKFFTSVADQAAGSVIQGSDLSFLCSPFQLQVRIAIAQSYARRSAGAAAQSCTLTSVVGNVQSFMQGNFQEGGWPGLISFTTVPTNNPFGAYASAQVLLNNRIVDRQREAERRLSPGGFLAREECDEVLAEDFNGSVTTTKTNCRIITHGAQVEQTLDTLIEADITKLGIADSIDQILSALFNSLITNVLQKGLANLSSRDVGGQVNAQDVQAATEAQTLLNSLKAAVQRAQQFGSVLQGSIADIQNAQSNLATLQACWNGKNEDDEADGAADQVAALETRVATYNNQITRANSSLTKIEQIQTQAISATNLSGVRQAAAAFTQAEAAGQLITATEITNAQQNRTTLQSEMAVINQQTSAELNQCYAS